MLNCDQLAQLPVCLILTLSVENKLNISEGNIFRQHPTVNELVSIYSFLSFRQLFIC